MQIRSGHFGSKPPQSRQRTSLQNATLAAESLRKLRVTEQKELGKNWEYYSCLHLVGQINPCSPFDPGRTWSPKLCKDTWFYIQFYVILYHFTLNYTSAPAVVKWTLQHTTVHGKIKVKYFKMGKKCPLKHTQKPLTILPKHTHNARSEQELSI